METRHVSYSLIPLAALSFVFVAGAVLVDRFEQPRPAVRGEIVLTQFTQAQCGYQRGTLVADPQGTEATDNDVLYFIEQGTKRWIGSESAMRTWCAGRVIPDIVRDSLGLLAGCPFGATYDTQNDTCPFTRIDCPFSSGDLVRDSSNIYSFFSAGPTRRHIGSEVSGFVRFRDEVCQGATLPAVKSATATQLEACETGAPFDFQNGSCPYSVSPPSPSPAPTPSPEPSPAPGPRLEIVSGSLDILVSPTDAAITWQTTLAATSSVQYGRTAAGEQRRDTTLLTKNHRVVLVGLEPNTSYYFYVVSRSGDQEIASATEQFRTARLPEESPTMELRDTAPPAPVRNVQVRVQNNAFALSWQNPPDRDLQFLQIYRSGAERVRGALLVSSQGIVTQFRDDLAAHEVALVCYSVQPVDKNGNQNTAIEQQACWKREARLPDPLAISQLAFTVNEDGDSPYITVSWQTNRPATSELLISRDGRFDSCANTASSGNFCITGPATLATRHEIKSESLIAGTAYRYLVRSVAADANTLPSHLRAAASAIQTFTLPARTGVAPATRTGDISKKEPEQPPSPKQPSILERLRVSVPAEEKDTTPPSRATDLSAIVLPHEADTVEILLSWQNPEDSDLAVISIFESQTPGYRGERIATIVHAPILPIHEQTSATVGIPPSARGGSACFMVETEDENGNRQEENLEQVCVSVADDNTVLEVKKKETAVVFSEPLVTVTEINPIRQRSIPSGEVETALLFKGEAREEVAELTLIIQSERQEFSFPPSSTAWRKLITARMLPGEHTAWAEGRDAQGKLVFTSSPVSFMVAAPACSDGIDNDRDGLTDYPEETGCSGPLGNREDQIRLFASFFSTPAAQAAGEQFFEGRTALENVRSDPETVGTTEGVVEPAATGGAVLPFLTLLNINRLGLLDLPNMLVFLMFWLLELFHVRPRTKRWGTVYDAVSKAMIPFARVKLYHPEERVFIAHEIANYRGEYGFGGRVVPGSYYLQTLKSGFLFPSEIVTTKYDHKFGPVYRGELVQVKQGERVPRFDVPLDPITHRAPTYARARVVNAWYRFIELLARGSIAILAIGIGLAAFATLIVPSVTNGIVLAIYGVLAILYFVTRRRSMSASEA